MQITQVTRRDIADSITVEQINWSGRLEESEFLNRIFDLGAMRSHDPRYSDAAGDIWQHRVNNPADWDDDWVFRDNRFNLMNCDDDLFLRFLAETIHPVIRPDITECAK